MEMPRAHVSRPSLLPLIEKVDKQYQRSTKRKRLKFSFASNFKDFRQMLNLRCETDFRLYAGELRPRQ
jgi:hypothetical protein